MEVVSDDRVEDLAIAHSTADDDFSVVMDSSPEMIPFLIKFALILDCPISISHVIPLDLNLWRWFYDKD